MENFIDKQTKFNTILNKIISSNKSSHAYMLVADNELLLKDASILLSKILICPEKFKLNCNECNICKRIDNNEFSEFVVINPVNNIIKKQEVIDLRDQFQTKTIEGKNRVYIVNNAEILGSSAANSILKFLEEPESNVIGIFTTTNLSNVLDTIKSRTQIIKLANNNELMGIEYVKNYCKCDDELIDVALKFVHVLEEDPRRVITSAVENLLNYLDNKEKTLAFMNVLLFIYYDLMNKIILNKTKYFIENDYFDKIVVRDEKIISKKISFVIENIEKINYNVNSTLFFSNFVIRMGEINDDKGDRN